ncbi:GDYXXLXY domain-containing protein [Tepidamorphus sp. 3E244]|uniref:GDYXXLXY domain-containing protein n=1 Tax=Tepidamorphus sp. 3E244 TaxID=3385498 RepID=UPI0038FCA80B
MRAWRKALPARALIAGGILVGLVQLAVPAAMIYQRNAILASGAEIVLKTEPRDPRDPFRGDYVVLNYEISSVETDAVPGAGDLARKDAVFVTIVPGEGASDAAWRIAAIDRTFPGTVEAGAHVLKAKVTSVSNWSDRDRVLLRYGIESYFVPEGQGKDLENLVRDGDLSVIVAVTEDGQSAIKGLVKNGETIYDEPLF